MGKRAENILDLTVVRRAKMPPWLLGHQWSGDSPGARLRQARIAKNMTIRDLCVATGLSVTAISNLEADKFNAALSSLRMLAKSLGVPISYLGCFEKLPENTMGQRITKARLYHGLTKKEMARAIGVDVKTLRHWEKEKHMPLPQYFKKLYKYLKVLKDLESTNLTDIGEKPETVLWHTKN